MRKVHICTIIHIYGHEYSCFHFTVIQIVKIQLVLFIRIINKYTLQSDNLYN
jgi:hypothetical protein